MWGPSGNQGDRLPPRRVVAVAIDRDKASQGAVKWAVDNLLSRGQSVVLIHVRVRHSYFGMPTAPYGAWSGSSMSGWNEEKGEDPEMKDLFLPFRVFCTRKDIQCHDVVLDDTDVSRALTEFVKQSAIDVLVLGATAKGSIFRFKVKDIPGSVVKGVPDFCTVYVIHKGKISSTRAASRPAPSILSPLRNQIMLQASSKYSGSDPTMSISSTNSRSSFSGNSRPGSEPSPKARQNEANYIQYDVPLFQKHNAYVGNHIIGLTFCGSEFGFDCRFTPTATSTVILKL